MNLTGKWSFSEDFLFGKDAGLAELVQFKDEITGILKFTETIEGEDSFSVKCQLSGFIKENMVTLNVASFEIIESSQPIDYYPEIREGIVNVKGQIVGSSEDEQGVCGVFVFERV